MAIEFACACGKKLRAAEEHAGKRARCKQCGQIATIPADKSEAAPMVARTTRPVGSAPKKAATVTASGVAALSGLDDLLSSELPPAEPVASVTPSKSRSTTAGPVSSCGRQCPSCRGPLPSPAVVCVNCGYNLNTGVKMTTVSLTEAEAPKKRPRSGIQQFFISRITSWKLWSGLGMMGLAALWFLFLTQTHSSSVRGGRGFITILILFVSGGISFINGLFDGDNA
jgi:hypothetical protein